MQGAKSLLGLGTSLGLSGETAEACFKQDLPFCLSAPPNNLVFPLSPPAPIDLLTCAVWAASSCTNSPLLCCPLYMRERTKGARKIREANSFRAIWAVQSSPTSCCSLWDHLHPFLWNKQVVFMLETNYHFNRGSPKPSAVALPVSQRLSQPGDSHRRCC